MNVTIVRILQVLVLAVCIQQARGADGCHSVWSSKPEPSPGGKWVAEAHKYLCAGGLGPAEEEDVELHLAGEDRTRITVLTPHGQWTDPAEVQLRWLNPEILEVSVPNRTIFDARVARYHGIAIKVI